MIEHWGDEHDVWLLPSIQYGLSLEHAWAPGTMSLTVRLFSDLLLTICEQAITATPARNLLIVNGHGGNRGVLEGLIQEIRSAGVNICVTHPSAMSLVRSGSPTPEVHGGMAETSIMLAVAEHAVHLERLDDSYVPQNLAAETVRRIVTERGVTWAWTSDEPEIASQGIIGDARKANVGSAVGLSQVLSMNTDLSSRSSGHDDECREDRVELIRAVNAFWRTANYVSVSSSISARIACSGGR